MLTMNLNHEYTGVSGSGGASAGPQTPGDTLLFDRGSGTALQAPDGHQLTFAEFNAVNGWIAAKRADSGTRVTLGLDGLVPQGTYSLSLVLLGAGPDPVGMGAASDDPKDSIFQADDDGEVLVTATKGAGPLSVRGAVPACWLTGSINDVMAQPMVAVTGSYLADGRSDGRITPQFSFLFLRLMLLNNEIRDSGGNQITDATPLDTPIYEYREQNQITAPSISPGGPRRPVTLGDFRTAYGAITTKCTKTGTEVAVHLGGLIPHGVYTIWLAKPDPTDSSKSLGFGALGSEDGASGNSFIADDAGEAVLVGTNQGGKLSGFGTIAPCWLTGEPIVQVAGVFHLDDQTHGPTAGPDGTYAAQFAYVFAQPPPQPAT
jgi:hypothetical protein